MKTTRVDKWLWSVRIFKSRSLAAKTCRDGKVKLAGKRLKSSYLIKPQDILHVQRLGYHMVYKVNKIISKRVSAELAKACYENLTPADELQKYASWFVGKGSPERRAKGTGRPTKKERRTIESYKTEHLYITEEE